MFFITRPNHKKNVYNKRNMAKTMQTYYSLLILLVVLFQSVYGNQNAVAFDKNYSDRLTANANQQSSLRQNNEAYHASDSNRFTSASATDPSQAPHETSHVNCCSQSNIITIFLCSVLFAFLAFCISL